MDHYEKKKQREREWYINKEKNTPLIHKILNSRFIYNPARRRFSYVYAKKQMAKYLKKRIGKKENKMLIAPCGRGDDYLFLNDLAEEIHGIDLSSVAISHCPPGLITRVGDILKSGYKENSFDIITSPLFLHHIKNFGFQQFMAAFYKILKPNGIIMFLEPSLWYPLNLITRPIKRIFNNPYREVDDEGPIKPKKVLSSLKSARFKNVKMEAATFSHPSFFIFFARIFNFLMKPFHNLYPFKNFGWLIIYSGRK